MSDVTDLVTAGVDIVRKSWGWFLTTGILLMFLGLFCLGYAQSASILSIGTLGWILLISAAAWLACVFYSFGWCGFVVLPNPIIRGVTGYILIHHPTVGAEGVTILLAALFIVLGVFRGLTATAYKFPRWQLALCSGLISCGLGVFLLTTWHTASNYLFGLVIGADLIFDGLTLVGFASSIHSLPEVQGKAA
jgi:uncharacterized membrane protein HdeD (DUF308 family)